jgi:hypothetical protein
MITTRTPYKLAEITRDMWPNLFYPPKDYRPPSLYKKVDIEYNQKNYSKNDE